MRTACATVDSRGGRTHAEERDADPSVIPRLGASIIPVTAAILLAIGGRRLGELTLLWGAVVLLLLVVSAIVSYMLETSLREIGERIHRIEETVGIDNE
jgi:hypothetical protein